jgi:hypothetical protein
MSMTVALIDISVADLGNTYTTQDRKVTLPSGRSIGLLLFDFLVHDRFPGFGAAFCWGVCHSHEVQFP